MGDGAYDWEFATDSRSLAAESWQRMLSENHLEWSLDEILWTRPSFSGSVRRRSLSDLTLVDCECDASSGHRGPVEVAATDGAYLVVLITLDGTEIVEQGVVQSRLTPGSVVVWDSETPAAFLVDHPLRKRSLLIPKAALENVGVRGRLQTGRVMNGRAPAVRLLTSYLDAIAQTIDEIPLGAIPAVRNATIELVSAALQVPMMDSPGSPTAVLAAAERYIEQNLRDPALSPAMIASMIGVSVRSLHRAFEESERSVSAEIRSRRLAAARDDLRGGLSVSSAARRWHFSDTSHFSRTFKREFGLSPSLDRR